MSLEIQHLLFLDLETTGISPKRDAIIEVAWILTDLNLREVSSSSVLISTHKGRIAEADYKIHRISPELLDIAGITSREALIPLHGMLKKSDILVSGYNVGFDFSFLYFEFLRLGLKPASFVSFDVMGIAKKVLGTEINNFRLSTVAEKLLKAEKSGQYHRARFDVLKTISVFRELRGRIQTDELIAFQPTKEYVLYQIQDAIKESLEIEIIYSFSSGGFSVYRLRPFQVNRRLLEAFEPKSKMKKNFLLAKILSIRTTNKMFPAPDYSTIGFDSESSNS